MTLRTPIKMLAAGIAAACLAGVAQAADIKFGFAAP